MSIIIMLILIIAVLEKNPLKFKERGNQVRTDISRN